MTRVRYVKHASEPEQTVTGVQQMHVSLQGKKVVHVATVGGDPEHNSSLGKLCFHLAELQADGHIQLTARLLPGPAHPEMVKAAALPDSHKIKTLMHAEVDIHLLEKAVLVDGQDINELKHVVKARSRGQQGQITHTWSANARHMASLLNWLMLADTAGLQIGPDCDGLLNFCDEPDSNSIAPADKVASELAQDAAEGTNGLLTVEGSSDEADVLPESSSANGHQKAGRGQAAAAEGGRKAAPVTVQQMLDSVALPDDSPAAIAPRALRTLPKHFQLQGLHWMLARERQGDALGR